MKKLKAFLVDDETPALEGLIELLRVYCPEVEVIGTAQSVKEAVPKIIAMQPDVAFIDVELPEGNGFDLAGLTNEISCSLVFVTGHPDYAQRAFTVDATHYLLKPVSYKDLRVAVARALVRRESAVAHKAEHRLRLSTSAGVRFVPVNEIAGIEGDGRYSTVHFVNEKPLLVTRNIGEFESELEQSGFFRAHKSWLVNCAHVVRFSGTDGGTLELVNGKKVLLSRRKKNEFMKRMEK